MESQEFFSIAVCGFQEVMEDFRSFEQTLKLDSFHVYKPRVYCVSIVPSNSFMTNHCSVSVCDSCVYFLTPQVQQAIPFILILMYYLYKAGCIWRDISMTNIYGDLLYWTEEEDS